MTSVIELNGKKYDAITGKLLSSDGKSGHAAPAKGTAIDFVRPTTNAVRQHAAPAATPFVAKQPKPALPVHANVTRLQPKHVSAHQPQHAKTLMRSAVRKPGDSFKKQAKTASHTGALVKQPALAVEPKLAALSIDQGRLKRAHHVPHSKLVRHFDTLNFARPVTSVARPVTRTPATVAAVAASPQPRMQAGNTPAAPVTKATAPKQPSADIFERALAQATSHKQPYHPIKKGKTKKTHKGRTALSIAASSLAILLIVGFIAYQNATAIQLRLVSSRAGISATLPKWQPAGFAIGKFAYAPGSVTVNYSDAQTNSTFTITQVATKWDSSALLNNFVNPNAGSTYNTIESAGSTIYTYGNNSATWVNNNIWYRLDTGGSLSTSQIVQLATSM